MMYSKKERVEIQEVYLKYISFIEKNLTCRDNFLCYMSTDLKYHDDDGVISCGFNDRMLPNAVSYLISEKPTNRLNKKIFNGLYFDRLYCNDNDDPWWDYDKSWPSTKDTDTINIAVNMEKIVFLKHLIKKLR